MTEACRQLNGRVEQNCSLVEVWVTARPPAQASATEAATATPALVVNAAGFRYTNGKYAQRWDAQNGQLVPMAIIESLGGVIEFGGRRDGGGDICWYLDSTFCHSFHRLKTVGWLSRPSVARALILSLVFIVSGCALLVQLWLTAPPLLGALRPRRHRCEHDPSCAGRCRGAMTVLARRSVFFTAVRFVLILTPWLAYRQIFAPCFDCFDCERVAHKLSACFCARMRAHTRQCNPAATPTRWVGMRHPTDVSPLVLG